MKMAVKDGQVILADVDPRGDYFLAIRNWGLMTWSRQKRVFFGPATAELLNRLSDMLGGRLPLPAEELRQKLNRIDAAVDRERMEEDPRPLCRFPVKLPLYRHQIRAANMALIVFGLIDPQEVKEEGGGAK